jgi:hypothetical protein
MPILWLVPATLAILPLLVYVPAFAQAMHMGMPDATHWALALGIGFACGLWFEPILRTVISTTKDEDAQRENTSL